MAAPPLSKEPNHKKQETKPVRRGGAISNPKTFHKCGLVIACLTEDSGIRINIFA